MIDMIESLMKGEPQYAAALRVAKTFWDEFFAEHAADDASSLQKAIESAQVRFQWALEEVGLIAPFAKSIMALTCIASLYDDGFEDRVLANRVVNALVTSKSLSLGIGSSATEVAALYDLED